ncbi:CU044_2847 family protein [Streptomyces cinereospinus]|uniref:CU044_2847 family protein n=1 Tax=Streptomyces cinereospinus TaxID=285561 RepID=A0ABV5MWI1_9ACTN
MLTPDAVRIPLDDGSSILVQVDAGEAPADSRGPVKAGRIADAVRELPRSVQEAMVPVTTMARAVLDQLRQAGPDEVTVEFGVNLAAQAGVVIAKSEANCHLRVAMTWNGAGTTGDPGAG